MNPGLIIGPAPPIIIIIIGLMGIRGPPGPNGPGVKVGGRPIWCPT